jgi:regulator of protease activity HflC (stomatin/prohibitin superfamily)
MFKYKEIFQAIQRVRVRSHEKGLHFKAGEFVGILDAGRYWSVAPFLKQRVEVVSQRTPWLRHDELDVMHRSGALKDHAVVLDLGEHERAVVRVDGRLEAVLGAGLYSLWSEWRTVETEIFDARSVRFAHSDLRKITALPGSAALLDSHQVEAGHVSLFYQDGRYVETLTPGHYAFWKGYAKVRILHVEAREKVLDIQGQDIMTRDKVTLRLNALATYRVSDAHKMVESVEDVDRALYRESQLALRAEVGARTLDDLLADKNALGGAVEEAIRKNAQAYGVTLTGFGIRDIILPGEMKALLNQVTEAKKAAEANLITRREETAAMRSQANTAKMLSENPTLMRLRELEILERVAASSKMNVVLGEKGLTDRVVNLL